MQGSTFDRDLGSEWREGKQEVHEAEEDVEEDEEGEEEGEEEEKVDGDDKDEVEKV